MLSIAPMLSSRLRGTGLALLLAVGLAAPAWAAPVGEVVALRGFATLVVDGITKPLKLGGQVEPGWEIHTAKPGRVKLKFIDGSVMVIGDASRLKIERFQAPGGGKGRDAGFFLDVGLVNQVVAPAPGGQWRMRTPSTVTAVRGTEFMVEVNPDKITDVHVATGAVSVEPLRKFRTRGELDSPPLMLDQKYQGVSCDAKGRCSTPQSGQEARMRALHDRLSGV